MRRIAANVAKLSDLLRRDLVQEITGLLAANGAQRLDQVN
jgi:hypothetical protein